MHEWRSRPVFVPVPPAGNGFTYVVPGSEEQILECVTFRLSTSAAVANRLALVQLVSNGGTRIALVGAPFVVAANLQSVFTFAVGLQQFGANGAQAIGGPLPRLHLQGGSELAVIIGSMGVADQLDDAGVYVRQRVWTPAE